MYSCIYVVHSFVYRAKRTTWRGYVSVSCAARVRATSCSIIIGGTISQCLCLAGLVGWCECVFLIVYSPVSARVYSQLAVAYAATQSPTVPKNTRARMCALQTPLHAVDKRAHKSRGLCKHTNHTQTRHHHQTFPTQIA